MLPECGFTDMATHWVAHGSLRFCRLQASCPVTSGKQGLHAEFGKQSWSGGVCMALLLHADAGGGWRAIMMRPALAHQYYSSITNHGGTWLQLPGAAHRSTACWTPGPDAGGGGVCHARCSGMRVTSCMHAHLRSHGHGPGCRPLPPSSGPPQHSARARPILAPWLLHCAWGCIPLPRSYLRVPAPHPSTHWVTSPPPAPPPPP